MSDSQSQQIVLTHWNAGVFHSTCREEDLLTNRAITGLLSDEDNFAVFSELLGAGLVKLLLLPLSVYPLGRRFDPVRLPISARAEEHQIRRSYKGKPWNPTKREERLFRRLDELVTGSPASARYHAPFVPGNPFAAQLGEILDNRSSYQLSSHPVFGYLDETTADQFSAFCNKPEEWRRFLYDHGVTNPIVGPDDGFYRSAAYQCANFLPTRRAILRLVESVYAATYCERETADGRYGGSELIELPYRYPTQAERTDAAQEALRVELAPTEAAADIVVRRGVAEVLVRTRASQEFASIRQILDALGSTPESPLLAETHFRGAWRDLCAVYAENSARILTPSAGAAHKIVRYAVWAFVLARVLGLHILPIRAGNLDLEVAEDAAVIAGVERLGKPLLNGFRALVRIPALRERMGASVGIRCSTVPLTIDRDK
jgi:hypothetical protein